MHASLASLNDESVGSNPDDEYLGEGSYTAPYSATGYSVEDDAGNSRQDTARFEDSIEEYDPASDPAVLAELQEQKAVALTVWTRRTKCLASLQILPFLMLLMMGYYTSSLVNLALVVFGYLGAFIRRHEYSFVYLVCNVVNGLKDLGMIVAYGSTPLGLVVVLIDLLVLTPAGLYVSYYLYNTVRSAVLLLQ